MIPRIRAASRGVWGHAPPENFCILGWILTQSEGLGELQGWCSDALLPLRTGNYKERQEKQRSSP